MHQVPPPALRALPSKTTSRYRFPKMHLAQIGIDLARERRRSLGADSAHGLQGAVPHPVALNTEVLPVDGPFIVVGNHYERPGLWAGWGAMVVNAAVWEASGRQRELHWLMASELLDVHLGPLTVPRSWMRVLLARFARMYGFGLVSARESGTIGGSAGLRAAARYLSTGEPVGVLPEGTASAALVEARPGVGAALEWLARQETPLVPVGVAERHGVLTANFGAQFHLPGVGATDRATRDRRLRESVMVTIARLLPPELRGYYAAAARAS
ncbi:MAG: hypothetical protein GEU73_15950 [Chloroflexi bacterium]|nr:hypothetical protein [Chloroflexota bacterium]